MSDIDIYFNFNLVKENYEDKSKKFREYRRKWVENPKKNIIENFPIHLDLEMNTTCNLKCYMCTYSVYPPEPVIGDLNLAKKIIDEGVEKGLCSIKTQFRGEPLLYKDMPELIRYAKEKGVIEAMFNTNATLLTEEKAKALIEAGLDKIICSVDSYTKDVYEQIRIGAKFETVLENIKKLQALKKSMGKVKPIVRLQMVRGDKNAHQLEGYVKFWGELVEQVSFDDMIDRIEFIEEDTPLEDWACPQLWQRLVVLADGDITPCCGGVIKGNEKLCVLGNAYNDSIEDVWKGEKLTELRKLHLEGRSHEIKMCRVCTMRKFCIENRLKK